MWSYWPSEEGEDEPEALASAAVEETEEARRIVPSAGTGFGVERGGAGNEGSLNNWEAQKGLLPSVGVLAELQSALDKHRTGSAMLKNELADRVLSCVELFRTRATSTDCVSLNKVRAVMILGPKP